MPPPWFPSVLPRDVWLRHATIPASLLHGVTLAADGEGLCRADLRMTDGRIAAITPAGATAGEEGINLDRGQVWPCFVDGHVHLDKTQTWSRQSNPDGTHPGAKAATIADRSAHWTEEDIATRFEFGLRTALFHGTASMRTHIDSYWPHAQIGWRVFRRMRDAWAGRIDLQASCLCPLERFADDDGVALADEVARSGGILGMTTTGAGGQADAENLDALLDRFFALAEDRQLEIDLHLDETGDPQSRTLDAVARTILRRKFQRPLQVGHVCSLAMQTEKQANETIAVCAEAGLRIINLPMCNMYLQGRVAGQTPRWRGITLVHEFAVAGVPVSFASDNCRDPFYAYGDYDMLEVYREAVRIAQLDHPFGSWAASVTSRPAASCGFKDRGKIEVGQTADVVLFRARSMTELLARPQSDRVVIRSGRVSDASLPDYRELDASVGAP